MIITDYQYSELVINSILFALFYMMASYFINNRLIIGDVAITSLLYMVFAWFSVSISTYLR